MSHRAVRVSLRLDPLSFLTLRVVHSGSPAVPELQLSLSYVACVPEVQVSAQANCDPPPFSHAGLPSLWIGGVPWILTSLAILEELVIFHSAQLLTWRAK